MKESEFKRAVKEFRDSHPGIEEPKYIRVTSTPSNITTITFCFVGKDLSGHILYTLEYSSYNGSATLDEAGKNFPPKKSMHWDELDCMERYLRQEFEKYQAGIRWSEFAAVIEKFNKEHVLKMFVPGTQDDPVFTFETLVTTYTFTLRSGRAKLVSGLGDFGISKNCGSVRDMEEALHHHFSKYKRSAPPVVAPSASVTVSPGPPERGIHIADGKVLILGRDILAHLDTNEAKLVVLEGALKTCTEGLVENNSQLNAYIKGNQRAEAEKAKQFDELKEGFSRLDTHVNKWHDVAEGHATQLGTLTEAVKRLDSNTYE